jgi:putative addiction module CopG family antidote
MNVGTVTSFVEAAARALYRTSLPDGTLGSGCRMPVRKAHDVSLTPEMEAFVDGQLASGRYRSASEVIHSALRLLAAGELGQDRETSARASLAVPHEGQAERGGLDGHFRAVLEIDTIGVVFFDDRGGIGDANDAFLRLVGFTRAEMAAGLLRYDERTPPEWRWKDDEVVAELAAGHEVAPFEKEYLRKDGSRIWILCAPKALGPGRAVEFVLDVTERRRAEERLRLIVENVPDYAIFTTDPDDRIETWLPGAEAIFGWSAEEAIGQPGAIIFTPQDRAAGVPAWELRV